jgi:tRNA(Ile)-lysidine synthetase-like protein
VLTHALVQVQRLLSLHLEVCHVNHRLRAESDSDQAFVEQQAEHHKLACHVVRLSELPQGENVEAWAREQRYRAFRKIMSERSLEVLVTAHTANDAAETLLMRLLANKELTSIEEYDARRGCIRPLLGISREQVDEYVARYALPFVEDISNQDTRMVRNRIRHALIPELRERFDPSIVWILADRARSLAADSHALQLVARTSAERIGEFVSGDGEWLGRCRNELSVVAPALRWRIVQILFTPALGHTLGEGKCVAILEQLFEPRAALELGRGVTLHVSSRGVTLTSSVDGSSDEGAR